MGHLPYGINRVGPRLARPQPQACLSIAITQVLSVDVSSQRPEPTTVVVTLSLVVDPA